MVEGSALALLPRQRLTWTTHWSRPPPAGIGGSWKSVPGGGGSPWAFGLFTGFPLRLVVSVL